MPVKSDYINTINTMRPTAANRTPVVTGPDISRAAAVGVTVAAPNTIEGNATTGSLPSANVSGQEIKNIAALKAQQWSDVRRLRFVRSGDNLTNEAYGNITVPQPGYGGPSAGSSFFNSLNIGQPISQAGFNSLISSLNTTVSNQTNILQHVITYCHSSCHSNCHVSRGRR